MESGILYYVVSYNLLVQHLFPPGLFAVSGRLKSIGTALELSSAAPVLSAINELKEAIVEQKIAMSA